MIKQECKNICVAHGQDGGGARNSCDCDVDALPERAGTAIKTRSKKEVGTSRIKHENPTTMMILIKATMWAAGRQYHVEPGWSSRPKGDKHVSLKPAPSFPEAGSLKTPADYWRFVTGWNLLPTRSSSLPSFSWLLPATVCVTRHICHNRPQTSHHLSSMQYLICWGWSWLYSLPARNMQFIMVVSKRSVSLLSLNTMVMLHFSILFGVQFFLPFLFFPGLTLLCPSTCRTSYRLGLNTSLFWFFSDLIRIRHILFMV